MRMMIVECVVFHLMMVMVVEVVVVEVMIDNNRRRSRRRSVSPQCTRCYGGGGAKLSWGDVPSTSE